MLCSHSDDDVWFPDLVSIQESLRKMLQEKLEAVQKLCDVEVRVHCILQVPTIYYNLLSSDNNWLLLLCVVEILCWCRR